MSNFWNSLLDTVPTAVGLTIYFIPRSGRPSLECVIEEDATISPKCARHLRFSSAAELAEAATSGELRRYTDFDIPPGKSASRYVTSLDFFLDPSRRRPVSSLLAYDIAAGTGVSSATKQQSPTASRTKKRKPRIEPIAGVQFDQDTNGSVLPRIDQFAADQSSTNFDQSETIIIDDTIGDVREEYDHNDHHDHDPPMPMVDQQSIEEPPRVVLRTKPCPGLEREAYADVVASRHWDGARRQFAPVVIQGEQMWARDCQRQVLRYKSTCPPCLRAAMKCRRARQKYKRHPVSDERRIRYSQDRWLSPIERVEKAEIQMKKYKEQIDALRIQATRTRALETELRKYRPQREAERVIVRNLVQYCASELEPDDEPICQWRRDENDDEERGDTCGHRTSSNKTLLDHIREYHGRNSATNDDGVIANVNGNPTTIKALYECKWKGCDHRRGRFGTLRHLMVHVNIHIGYRRMTQNQIAQFRDQLLGFCQSIDHQQQQQVSSRRRNPATAEAVQYDQATTSGGGGNRFVYGRVVVIGDDDQQYVENGQEYEAMEAVQNIL